MRWWWLLRANRLKVGVFEIQRLAWIGLFFSNVIPGTTGGDVVKAIYIAKRCSTDKVRALVSVVVDRIIGLLSLLFLACLASLLAIDKFPSFAITIWLTGGGAILVYSIVCPYSLFTIKDEYNTMYNDIHKIFEALGNSSKQLH